MIAVVAEFGEICCCVGAEVGGEEYTERQTRAGRSPISSHPGDARDPSCLLPDRFETQLETLKLLQLFRIDAEIALKQTTPGQVLDGLEGRD